MTNMIIKIQKYHRCVESVNQQLSQVHNASDSQSCSLLSNKGHISE